VDRVLEKVGLTDPCTPWLRCPWVEFYDSDALPSKICVYPPRWSAFHDNALADEDAVSSTIGLLVAVALWLSQLRSSWYQQSWSYKSLLMTPTAYLCMWHGASHACCAVVEVNRTMPVQNNQNQYLAKTNRVGLHHCAVVMKQSYSSLG